MVSNNAFCSKNGSHFKVVHQLRQTNCCKCKPKQRQHVFKVKINIQIMLFNNTIYYQVNYYSKLQNVKLHFNHCH